MAVLRMRAVSVISTMNVLWPRASSSLAPTRAKMRSATPIVAARGRHEAADLRHQREQRGLADVGALAGHVGAGDEERWSSGGRRSSRSSRMRAARRSARTCPAASRDVEHRVPAVDRCRARARRRLVGRHVAARAGQLGEAGEHVDLGERVGRGLQPRGRRRRRVSRSCEKQLVLELLRAAPRR